MPTLFWDTANSSLIDYTVFDTPHTKLNKLAYKIKSLPKYLWFWKNTGDSLEQILASPQIYVENVAHSGLTEPDPIGFLLKRDIDIRPGSSLDYETMEPSLKEALKNYLGYWMSSPSRDVNLLPVVEPAFSNLGGDVHDYSDSGGYLRKLKKFLSEQEKKIQQESDLRQLPDNPNMGNYTMTRETQTLEFIIEDITPLGASDNTDALFSIFNALHVDSNDIHFITFNSYFKVIQNFIPPENWLSEPDYVSIKIAVDELSVLALPAQPSGFQDLARPGKYLEYKIGINDDRTAFTLTFTNDAPSLGLGRLGTPAPLARLVSGDSFADRILYLLNSSSYAGQVVQSREPYLSNIEGYISVLGAINHDIIGDLIFNQPPFSSYFSYSDKLQFKDRPDDRSIYFELPTGDELASGLASTGLASSSRQGNIRASILKTKIATKDDIYPYKTLYTLIRVSQCRSMDTLGQFVYMVKKLLSLYESKKHEIIKKYASYHVTLHVARESDRTDTLRYGKDLAPEIMGQGFSKKCQPISRLPKIIQDNDPELQGLRERGRIFEFPINHPTIKAYKLACLNDKFPYLALVENDKAPLGWQPCCSKRMKNAYTDYVRDGKFKNADGDVIIVEEASTRATISTSKIIRYSDTYGRFPREHAAVPQTIQFRSPPGTRTLRRGTDMFPSSFLECVLLGVGRELPANPVERVRLVNKERQRLLSNPLNINYLRQEMYGFSDVYMTEFVNNIDTYLDPLYATKLLENTYNCTITLFEKNAMVLPRHQNGYYEFHRDIDLPAVYVYINQGAPSDNLAHPHCELIVSVNPGAELVYAPETKQFVADARRKLNCFYSKAKQYVEFPKEVEFYRALLPQAQVIDFTGKVRMLLIKGVWVETSPIPPMLLPVVAIENLRMSPVDVAQASELLQEFCVGEILYDRLYVYSGNSYVDMKIYTNPIKTKYYEKFVTNNKLARYLTNWFNFLFSDYMHTNNPIAITKPVLDDFLQNNTRLDETFEYDISLVKDTFLLRRGLFQGNLLVINSQELVEHLLFQLLMEINRGLDKLKAFRDNVLLKSYYINVYDFQTRPNEVLIKTSTPINIYLAREQYILYDTPVPAQQANKYFFANNNITAKAFGAHETPRPRDLTEFNLFKFNNKFSVDHFVVATDEDASSTVATSQMGMALPSFVVSKTATDLLYTELSNIN
jgi:hypothetical protein